MEKKHMMWFVAVVTISFRLLDAYLPVLRNSANISGFSRVDGKMVWQTVRFIAERGK